MKKWIIIGIAIVLVAALVIGIIVLSSAIKDFWQSDFYKLGEYTHLNMQQDCYSVSLVNGEMQVDGKSTFSINGIIRPYFNKDGHHFEGHMEVGDYPLPMKDSAGGFSAHYLQTSLQFSNQGLTEIYPEAEHWYWVFMSETNPENTVILVSDVDSAPSVTYVCADSPEQALERYDYFLNYLMVDKEP